MLLNPDEIGRFLARVDNRDNPAYPGIALALIPGEQPLPVQRVNYFESKRFDAFCDPHSDYPAPPTLAERIARLAALRRTEPEKAAPSRRKYVIAAAITAITILTAAAWWIAPRPDSSNQARLAPPAPRIEPAKLTPSQTVSPPAAATETAQPPTDDRLAVLRPPVSVPPPELSPSDPHDVARDLQSELHRVGCYNGMIDGDRGLGSVDALRRFNQRIKTNLDTSSCERPGYCHD